MDAIRELKAVHAQLEQAQAKAQAIVAQEASDDALCCEYCMALHAMAEGIDDALYFAADATEAERAHRKAEAEGN